ncbi:hypothetical protein RQN46_09420 [Arcanobacterium hippocoleae]
MPQSQQRSFGAEANTLLIHPSERDFAYLAHVLARICRQAAKFTGIPSIFGTK